MVVAMGYSVTVSAAALMMEKLYGELFAERGIPEAIRLGRKALYNDKNRRVYFNQVVESRRLAAAGGVCESGGGFAIAAIFAGSRKRRITRRKMRGIGSRFGG